MLPWNRNRTIPCPRNTHPGRNLIIMLEGKLKIILNNQEIILNEGDSLYFDSGIPHDDMQAIEKTARFLAVIL